MKILLVQDYLRSGGTERQTVLLAKSFHESGHLVQVLTFRPGGALAATLVPIHSVALQPFDLGLDWFAPGLKRAVRRFGPEVVLCLGRMANSRAGALQDCLRRSGSKAIVVGTMRTGKTLPRLFRQSLRQVRHVVANSADAKRVLVERYAIDPKRISVIRNALVFPPSALPSAALASERLALRQTMGARETTLVMLCVAMFRPEKNQRALLEVAAALPSDLDWQLWLVGEGETKAAVQRLAAQKGIEARVKFFGFRTDPSPLYRAADLAVLASLSESLSNFLIEAHAHALPSVAFDVMGVKECGGQAVAVGDEVAFAAEILRASRDVSTRHEEGARLAAFARESFSAEARSGEYLRLFEALLKK